MARLPRLYVAGQPQQVILRTGATQPAFLDEADYAFFAECLRLATRTHRAALHAYVLMPTQVQLLATPHDEASLPNSLQALGRRYVAYFNRRHGRSGALWEGRYRATVVEAERYLLTCMRMLDTAPVRCELVLAAAEYRWSSYRAHAGLAVDPLITDHPLYWALGNTPFERQRTYRDLCEQPLDAAQLAQLRDAALKGWVLGSPTFVAAQAPDANRRLMPLPRGRRRKNSQ